MISPWVVKYDYQRHALYAVKSGWIIGLDR